MQPRLIVSTRQNVISSLCPKTGSIVWRQVLEDHPRGELKLFQAVSMESDASNTAAAYPNSKQSIDLITVQGHAPAVVRGWNSYTGYSEWEWSLMPVQTEKSQSAFWAYSNTMLYHIVPTWGSHLEVTPYFARSGQTPGTTTRVMAPWVRPEKCVVSGSYYVCVEGNQLLSLDLTENDAKVFTKELENSSVDRIENLEVSKTINVAIIL